MPHGKVKLTVYRRIRADGYGIAGFTVGTLKVPNPHVFITCGFFARLRPHDDGVRQLARITCGKTNGYVKIAGTVLEGLRPDVDIAATC